MGKTWAPLRRPTYRALWTAQLISNVGTWMQNVGAIWLMGDLHGSTAQIALIQTATSLPVIFAGPLAGSLADIVDRRKLLLVTQSWMLVTAAVLAGLSAAEAMTPNTLLMLTFSLGLGAALTLPAWQAIQPDLVSKEELGQAVSLGSVSMNIGRSIGPAIGGALVAASGPEAVFSLNAVSFAAVLFALATWKFVKTPTELPPERLRSALRAGVRYGRHSPALRAVLARGVLYVVPASAVMALLPVIARDELHLGSRGFGALFTAFGIGAIVSALLLPRAGLLRTDAVILVATLGVAFTCACMALIEQPIVLGLVLVVGGASWTAGFSTFNVSTQRVLPAWVRARGMGLYVFVMHGGLAFGSALWGLIAQRHLTTSLLIAAATLLTGTVASLRWKLTRTEQLDLESTTFWEEPVVIGEFERSNGPVLVTIEYDVRPQSTDAFRAAMTKVRRMRRRTGARRWGLYRDATSPHRFVETFVVESWEEHLRQRGRTTRTDEQIQALALSYVESEQQTVRHLLWAY